MKHLLPLLLLEFLLLLGCSSGRIPGKGTNPSAVFPGMDDKILRLESVTCKTSLAISCSEREFTLAFDPANRQISGFTGCNRFSGSYEQVGDSLVFGALASTKKACIGYEDEADCLALLHFTKYHWKIGTNDSLMLTGKACSLVFILPEKGNESLQK